MKSEGDNITSCVVNKEINYGSIVLWVFLVLFILDIGGCWLGIYLKQKRLLCFKTLEEDFKEEKFINKL
jgi:hypothetical protein